MSSHALSAADPYERRQVPVLDTKMAYIDTGEDQFPSGENPPMSHRLSMATPNGLRTATYRNCSSTRIPARF